MDQANQSQTLELNLQKIYTKDISFESPNTPAIFQTEWHPSVEFELHIETNKLADEFYEVGLKITATNKSKEQTVFLIEIEQVGIFQIKHATEEQLSPILGVACPNIIFPYARELVSELTLRGGFPPLYLTPINFEALYQQHQVAEVEKETH